MNTNKLFLRKITFIFVLFTLMAGNTYAAITDLATSPITVKNTSLEVLPNILFVLDDSGSMQSDFLPDWADPLLSFSYLYKNAAYNGVAYNPAVYYKPPVMYTSAGTLNTTIYKSQTSVNTSDWTVVKNDGYGVQSTATSVLKNNAYFYTTIPGEYCDSPQLRNCVASLAATGSYTKPAKLRWCDTPAAANGTTANANVHCQAAQIASTATNIANGVQSYTFPRSPSIGGVSSVSFAGVGGVTVNGITIGATTAQIMSVVVNNTVAINSDGSSLPGLLNAITNSINACTAAAVGACTVSGYSAVNDGISVISISAPAVTTLTPVVNMTSTIVPITNPDGTAGTSHVVATAAAFAQTPGSILKTVITSTTLNYPYPGNTVKSSNRSDCASATTCTYDEEMTNYANWWAYYHTRMQTMKTDVSIAFSILTDQFRVGYFSINNGSYRNPSSPNVNNDYLDISAFSNTQKYSWYTKIFNAYPYGQTPLRLALSNAGRMYAGKLATLNNTSVTDPMQYSCQQNFTILSTDGYWNDQTVPKQVDGTTDIGEQDDRKLDGSTEDRPYYDGATQTQTVSQTLKSVKQVGSYETTLQSKTTQQYKSSSDLTQTVITTDTYPWKVQTSTLQTSTSTLQQAQRDLQSTTTKLQSSTYDLKESAFQPNASTYPLITSNFVPQSNTFQLQQYDYQPRTNTYALNQTIFNPNTNTFLMQKKVTNPDVSTYPLNISNFKPNQNTYAVNKLDFQPQTSTFALQQTTYQLQSTTTPLTKTTYGLQQSTSQLQKRVKISTNGGDTYTDTGWQNESTSCTAGTVSSGSNITITTCQYTAYTSYSDVAGSCTTINQSTAAPFTVATAVNCQYSTTPVVTTGQPSCTANAAQTSSPYNPKVNCAYGTSGSPVNVTSGSCTTNAQQTSSPYQASVSCGYAPGVTTTVTACSSVAKSVSSPFTQNTAIDCGYAAAVVTTGASCSVTAKQTTSPYSGPAVTCAYPNTATTTTNSVASCTVKVRGSGSTTGSSYPTATDCSYATTPTTTSVATCTYGLASSGITDNSVWSPYNTCSYPGTATSTSANQTACNIVTRASATTNNASYSTATDCAYGSAVVTSASSCTVKNKTTTGTSYTGPAVTCSYPGAATTTTSGVACTTQAPQTATTDTTVYNPKTDCAYSTTATTTSSASCTVNVASTGPTYNAQYNTCSYPTVATTTNNSVSSCNVVAATGTAADQSTWNSKTACAYATTPTTASAATCTSVAASSGPTNYSGPYKTCTYPGVTSTTNVATCTPIAQSTSNTYQTARTCGYATTATVTNGSCTYNNGTIVAGVYTSNRVICSYPTTATSTVSGVACTVATRQTGTTDTTVWNTATDCAYSPTATVTTGTTCTVKTGSTGPTSYTETAKVSCAYPTTATATNTVATCNKVDRATATTNNTAYGVAKDCAYSTTATVVNNLDTCTSVNRSAGPSSYSGPAVDCLYQSPVVTTGTSCAVSTATTTAVTNGSTYTKGVACSYAAAVNSNVTSCTTAAMSAGPTNYTGPAVTCSYGTYSAPVNATAACVPAAQSAGPTNYTGPAVNCTYTSPAVTTYSGTCTAAAQNNTNLTSRICTAGTYPFVISTVPSVVSSCTPGDPTTTTAGVTRDIATSCVYNAYTAAAPALCTAVPQGIVSGTYPTAVNCTTGGDLDFVNVPSCNPAGTISPLLYDSSGKIVQCRTTAPTAVVPVNTCTASIGPGPAYTQTNCQTLQDSITPVQNCAAVPGSSANNYVNTTCNSSSIQSNIAICTTQLPSASNGYKTVTCGSTGGTSNTLADVAQYYYKTDLRTTAFGNCVGAPAGSTNTSNLLCADPDDAYNNVPTNGVDLNPAQHMTTFTLGLGASGFMQYTDNYKSGGSSDFESIKTVTAANPASGICSWQNGGDCNWPFPINNDQTGVDDLWHAGVNGRASYFSATDPTTLANSLATALSSVSAARGTSSSASSSTANITATNNYIFSSTFATGSWDGELVRSQISAVDGSVSSTGGWAAQAKLDAKPYASRSIYTYDSSSTNNLKSFDVANYGGNTTGSANFKTPNINTSTTGLTQFLCISPTVCLNSTDQGLAAGDNLVNFIRGDRSNEGALTDNTKYYRQRSHVLGDIVNSTANYVAAPQYLYSDAGYSSFASTNANRLPIVYVGSNDGMLHAFRGVGSASTEQALALYRSDTSNVANQNAAIAAQNADILAGVDGGRELWAYIPSMVLPNLYKLADKNYSALHQYFVDGVQETADICVSNCGTSTALWKTILVGGLGHGGRGYFALDITDPANPKGLWEYTDTNLGYTYGNPQIAKQADGTWVVVFSSGYNNVANADGPGGDGQGRLYVLNAYTGQFIRSIPTGIGNTTTPSGLSKIVAEVVNGLVDSTVQAVYGGDLLGNLWRFDINNNTGAAGYDAQLMVTLADGAGNRQPLTAKPTIALVNNNTVVYVGTGQYLAASDVNNVNTQSVYAIKDPFKTNTTPSVALYSNPRSTGSTFIQQLQTSTLCPTVPSGSNFVEILCKPGDTVRTSTNNTVDFATNGGWFVDLVDSGERANTDLLYALNLLIFTTNVPSAAACNLGGYSFAYFLDYRTGGPASSEVTNVSGVSLGSHLSAGALVNGYGTDSGSLYVPSTDKTCVGGYCTPPVPKNSTPEDTRRTSWRELISP